MYRDELMHFIRKMIDYEENELVARYRIFQKEEVPEEDMQVFKAQMDASVRHAKILTDLLSEITKEAKDEY